MTATLDLQPSDALVFQWDSHQNLAFSVDAYTADEFWVALVEIEASAHHPHRATIAATFGKGFSPRHALTIRRAARNLIDRAFLAGIKRIECAIPAGYDKGQRIMRALGFEPEGLMRCYAPNGDDCLMYSMVRR